MAVLAFHRYARSIPGLFYETMRIGSTDHSPVVAVAGNDEVYATTPDDESLQAAVTYYQLRVALSASVTVGEAVTFQVSDTLNYTGKVTSIQDDVHTDCRHLLVAGRLEEIPSP